MTLIRLVMKWLLSVALLSAETAWPNCDQNLAPAVAPTVTPAVAPSPQRCRGTGCITLGVTTFGPGKLPERPGQLIDQGNRYVLDKGTFAEIDAGESFTNGLIQPVLNEMETPFGRQRLWWEIENPLLNLDLIHARQEAVQALMADRGQLMTVLRNLFRGHGWDGTYIDNNKPSYQVLMEGRSERKLFKDPVEALNNLGFSTLEEGVLADAGVLLRDYMGSMIPLAIAQHSDPWVVLFASVAFGGSFMLKNTIQPRGFEEAHQLAKIFSRNDADLVGTLKKTQVPLLQEIADTLNVVNDPDRPDSLVATRRALKWATLLQNTLLLPSHVQMSLVTRRLGKKIEHIAAYLDAISELEMLMGLASYGLKTQETHRFLTVNAPETGEIVLDNVYNPYLYALEQKNGNENVPTHFHFNPSNRVELVTGANAEGKSTGLRTEIQVSLASQIGYPVPAQGKHIPMVFISGNKVSDGVVGKSLMMAQCERVAQMLNAAIDLEKRGIPVMLKFDEPFDGTSPEERRALVAAIIIFIGNHSLLYSSIATHERSLIGLVSGKAEHELLPLPEEVMPAKAADDKYAQALAAVRNVHYANFKKNEGGAQTRNALKIAEKMGMPSEVLAIARDLLARSGVESGAPAW